MLQDAKMSVSQQNGLCVKQCGFHVSDAASTPEDVDTISVMVPETNAHSCMTASLLAETSMAKPGELEMGKKTMYRISKTILAPASMSPGLAMSQGDMTLADHSHLTPGVKKMMRSVVRGLKAYQEPEAATEGLGGTYFFKSEHGANIAIMKPCDEEPLAPSNPKGFVGRELGEPGLKPSVRVGEAASREVAAYLLDHGRYAGVPHTVMVRMSHPIFHYNDISNVDENDDDGDELPLKLGSLQSFVRHECDTTEMGTSLFNKKDVHRIGILDIRLFNTDRHGGNILVKSVKNTLPSLQKNQYQLIPIDHGFALPEGLEPPYFEWQHWPQAMLPFDKEELDYIANLDAKSDVELLRRELPDIHESSFRILELATLLLQECAAAGLTLSEIAGVMTRPMIGIDEEPSELENVCLEIRREMFQDLKSAQEASVPISHFSSMSISEVAEETADSTPDSGSAATFFGIGDEMDNSATGVIVTKGEDVLFSMDEDGGAKTPSPSSPNMTKRDTVYNDAPYLMVRTTGELGTPFETTFKSALGETHGVSPIYDSDSPTHPQCDEDQQSRQNSTIVDFRGAQSYVPVLPKFATGNTKQKKFHRAISRGNIPSMTDRPLEEPRGCYDSSYALADMDEKEWQLFLSKAASKIAAAISSGVWQDTFGQVQQMSCPRF